MNPLFYYPLHKLKIEKKSNSWGLVDVAPAIEKIYKPTSELIESKFGNTPFSLYIPCRRIGLLSDHDRQREQYHYDIERHPKEERADKLPKIYFTTRVYEEIQYIIPVVNSFLPIICAYNNTKSGVISAINCSGDMPFLEDIEQLCSYDDGQCSNKSGNCQGICSKKTFDHSSGCETFYCDCS